MKKTLLSAAIMATAFSTSVSASQTGEAVAAYDEPFSELAFLPNTVFGNENAGPLAPVDSRVATVVSIPGALAACSDPSCGESVLTAAVNEVTDASDLPSLPPEEEPSAVTPETSDEAPLSITGEVAAADDACSVNMPASVDFSFDIDRAAVGAATPDGTTGAVTFTSDDTVQIDFVCGQDRQSSDPLVVSFSTADTSDGTTAASDSVTASFTSTYHTDIGAEENVTATVQYDDESSITADKTMTSDASQNVILQAAVTLTEKQAKGGTFETDGTTLYVYLD